ncbi:ABC transporter permease [Rothia mucilaginosa]|uniref:ABC transporter permease n=1 Tax=Rothia mucilaginosa TaxID=43675 RepID=UPI001EFA0AB2|nr:ABC transporter permease subunit [Rothia mucilaginosa]
MPVLFLVPASLGIFLIAGPLLGLFLNIPWGQLGSIFTPQVLGAANLSLSTAAASTLICGLLGAPLALVLSKVLNRSRLHRFGSVLYAIIYTPVILSPVVSGLGLLFFWGRKGMIGTYLYQAGISIPFTPNAVIIAQVFVALPFFVATAVTTLQAIPREYEEIALVEGAKPAEITFKVLLPLAAPGLATAFLLSFARALGEYGATVTFAGNVQGKTQTIPLAIDLAINSSDIPSALGSALILISLYLGIFGVLGLIRALKKLRESTR